MTLGEMTFSGCRFVPGFGLYVWALGRAAYGLEPYICNRLNILAMSFVGWGPVSHWFAPSRAQRGRDVAFGRCGNKLIVHYWM